MGSQTARSTGINGPARSHDFAERVASRKRYLLLVDAAGLDQMSV